MEVKLQSKGLNTTNTLSRFLCWNTQERIDKLKKKKRRDKLRRNTSKNLIKLQLDTPLREIKRLNNGLNHISTCQKEKCKLGIRYSS